MTPETGRALVVASLPQCCPLCSGVRAVRLVWPDRARGGGPVRCPHCGPKRMPVVHLPSRTDIPSGDAA